MNWMLKACFSSQLFHHLSNPITKGVAMDCGKEIPLTLQVEVFLKVSESFLEGELMNLC